jgi:hypothetical protein
LSHPKQERAAKANTNAIKIWLRMNTSPCTASEDAAPFVLSSHQSSNTTMKQLTVLLTVGFGLVVLPGISRADDPHHPSSQHGSHNSGHGSGHGGYQHYTPNHGGGYGGNQHYTPSPSYGHGGYQHYAPNSPQGGYQHFTPNHGYGHSSGNGSNHSNNGVHLSVPGIHLDFGGHSGHH